MSNKSAVLFHLTWKPTEVYKYIPIENIMFTTQHFPHCLSGFLQLFAWLNYQGTWRTLTHFWSAPKALLHRLLFQQGTAHHQACLYEYSLEDLHKIHCPSRWRWLQVHNSNMGPQMIKHGDTAGARTGSQGSYLVIFCQWLLHGQRGLFSDKQRNHQGLIIQPRFSMACFMHRNIYFFLLQWCIIIKQL